MTREERIIKVNKIKNPGKRIHAVACHQVMNEIEENGSYRMITEDVAEVIQKGILSLFEVEIHRTGKTLTLP